MKFQKLLISNAIGLIALLVSVTAHAQWVVVDPTNLVQNTSTAIAAVKTEASTAASYIAQLKANIELVKSTMSLDGLAKLTGLQAELATTRDLMKANEDLQSVLKQGQNLYTDINAQFGASNFSWKTFFTSQNQSNLNRANWIMDQVSSMNKNLESAAARRQDIVNTMQSAQGPTQATQGVGAAVDVVIGQNQQIITALQTQLAVKANEEKLQAQSDQVSNDRYSDYQKKMRDEAAKFK